MDNLPEVRISNTERMLRKKAVSYARASIRLEGFVLTLEQERRAQAFINGELTLVEFTSSEEKTNFV
ncbi:antitoxin VbhA family protein [Pseudomonas sp. FYR_7]|uniref:antitoxin VbhA family protein n=1 Tax=Pseudomonas sp. FYR_7 TaxID=3367174 RepID=UPI00370A8092